MARKAKEKAADPASTYFKKPPERWPFIRQFKHGTGVFRPRIIPWTRYAVYAMNPYSMGLAAYFCVHVTNFMSLFSGGTFNPKQRFQPPVQYREAFLAAYNLAKEPGKWLGLGMPDPKDEARHELFEYDLLMTRKPYELRGHGNDNFHEIDWWNGWFASKTEEMERIHQMLTAQGIGEPQMISVPIEEWEAAPDDVQEAIAAGLEERERLALV